ncbi:MAG: DUF4244 domain-containing protein [Brevundimonas sp.]
MKPLLGSPANESETPPLTAGAAVGGAAAWAGEAGTAGLSASARDADRADEPVRAVPDELEARRRLRAVRPRTTTAPLARARHARDRLRGAVNDAGMATAEYAIATLAAVGFAGLLVVILKGNEVRGLLSGIVRRALTL